MTVIVMMMALTMMMMLVGGGGVVRVEGGAGGRSGMRRVMRWTGRKVGGGSKGLRGRAGGNIFMLLKNGYRNRECSAESPRE